MTSRAIRDEAARIITSFGARDDQAESILRAFTAAGLNIIRQPAPIDPQTGPKAERPQAWDEARRALKGMTTNTEETP